MNSMKLSEPVEVGHPAADVEKAGRTLREWTEIHNFVVRLVREQEVGWRGRRILRHMMKHLQRRWEEEE